MNRVAAHVDVVVIDGNVLRRIFIYNRQAIVVDRRVARHD